MLLKKRKYVVTSLLVCLLVVLWCPIEGQAATTWEIFLEGKGEIYEVDTSRLRSNLSDNIYEINAWLRYHKTNDKKWESITKLGVRVILPSEIIYLKTYQGAIYRKNKVFEVINGDDWEEVMPDTRGEQIGKELYRFTQLRDN